MKDAGTIDQETNGTAEHVFGVRMTRAPSNRCGPRQSLRFGCCDAWSCAAGGRVCGWVGVKRMVSDVAGDSGEAIREVEERGTKTNLDVYIFGDSCYETGNEWRRRYMP